MGYIYFLPDSCVATTSSRHPGLDPGSIRCGNPINSWIVFHHRMDPGSGAGVTSGKAAKMCKGTSNATGAFMCSPVSDRKGRFHAAGMRWKLGVEREISASSSVISTGISANSGVVR